MRRYLTWGAALLLLPLLTCGCVHKALIENGNNPGPGPGPSGETRTEVTVHVSCTQVRHTDAMEKASFELTGLYPSEEGESAALSFAAAIGEDTLTGEVACYGHCLDGETCTHELSIIVKLSSGEQKVIRTDVSSQMKAQQGAADVYIVVTDEIAPEQMVDFGMQSGGGIAPLEPGDNHDVS